MLTLITTGGPSFHDALGEPHLSTPSPPPHTHKNGQKNPLKITYLLK